MIYLLCAGGSEKYVDEYCSGIDWAFAGRQVSRESPVSVHSKRIAEMESRRKLLLFFGLNER